MKKKKVVFCRKENDILLESTNWIDKIPGYFGVVDKNSNYLFSNDKNAKLMGLKNAENLIGRSYSAGHNKVAEASEELIKQDKQVILTDREQKFLGYYCYGKNGWKIILDVKTPYKNDSGKTIGVVINTLDITNDHLVDLGRFLMISGVGYKSKIERKQFSFSIQEGYLKNQLSARESECLFFLLRGKSTKTIAKILNISFRTVETYIHQLKIKLGCASKSQLIEFSIANGYMAVFPESLFEILKNKKNIT